LFRESLLQFIREVILFIAQVCTSVCSFHTRHCFFLLQS